MITDAKLRTPALLLLTLMSCLAGCGDDPMSPGSIAALDEIFAPDEAGVVEAQTEGQTDIVLRLLGVTFATGEASLRPESEAILDKFDRVFALYPHASYTVEGHTDSRGSQAYNMTLSSNRASTVRAYLLEQVGQPAGGIEAEGYGETRPIADNGTAAGRARNRRIDVIISP